MDIETFDEAKSLLAYNSFCTNLLKRLENASVIIVDSHDEKIDINLENEENKHAQNLIDQVAHRVQTVLDDVVKQFNQL